MILDEIPKINQNAKLDLELCGMLQFSLIISYACLPIL